MIIYVLNFSEIVVEVGIVGEVSRRCNNRQWDIKLNKKLCKMLWDARLLVLFSQRVQLFKPSAPKRPNTLLQLLTPAKLCSFHTVLRNHRSYKHNVRYTSGITSSHNRSNSGGKTCLKRQKSPKTTTNISSIDFTCGIFIFRHIYRSKSTVFCFSYYS